MKIKLLCACLLAALSVGVVVPSRAQILDQAGVLGSVGWSTSAPLCQTLPGSPADVINYSAPSFVSFATNSYGTIGLICTVPGIANGLLPDYINNVAFTFSNPNASYGCSTSVQLVDRTTASPVYGWSSGSTNSYSGIWTVNVGSSTTSSLRADHTYDVELYLTRSRSAGNSCNPRAYAAFLEEYYPIY